MKRTLCIIRHAKSSWANAGQKDFDRPLNDRGEYDAPLMGKRLKELGIVPDLIISSTAKRAKQTARKIATGTGFEKEEILLVDKLYHCIPSVFEEVIKEMQDDKKCVFIVAHNPGITDFVNQLSEKFSIDNMPTCGVVAVQMDIEKWSDFSTKKKEVILFEYPKNLYGSK